MNRFFGEELFSIASKRLCTLSFACWFERRILCSGEFIVWRHLLRWPMSLWAEHYCSASLTADNCKNKMAIGTGTNLKYEIHLLWLRHQNQVGLSWTFDHGVSLFLWVCQMMCASFIGESMYVDNTLASQWYWRLEIRPPVGWWPPRQVTAPTMSVGIRRRRREPTVHRLLMHHNFYVHHRLEGSS